MICYLLSRSLYMDICLPVCGGVFRKFLKTSLLILESFHLFVRVFNWTFSKNLPTIIGNLPYPLAGCFKKFAVIFFLYYYWTLPVRNLMVYAKLFSLRQRSPHCIWTTESKNFVFFRKKISLYYNWKLPARK